MLYIRGERACGRVGIISELESRHVTDGFPALAPTGTMVPFTKKDWVKSRAWWGNKDGRCAEEAATSTSLEFREEVRLENTTLTRGSIRGT